MSIEYIACFLIGALPNSLDDENPTLESMGLADGDLLHAVFAPAPPAQEASIPHSRFYNATTTTIESTLPQLQPQQRPPTNTITSVTSPASAAAG